MQATVEATRQYWWLFAVVGAVVAGNWGGRAAGEGHPNRDESGKKELRRHDGGLSRRRENPDTP